MLYSKNGAEVKLSARFNGVSAVVPADADFRDGVGTGGTRVFALNVAGDLPSFTLQKRHKTRKRGVAASERKVLPSADGPGAVLDMNRNDAVAVLAHHRQRIVIVRGGIVSDVEIDL